MVTPSVGSVVLVTFPFSDLSTTKRRPSIVLAFAGRGDWVLCQVTSNPYSDPHAVEISGSDFSAGSLRTTSYARPGKLFTASERLMTSEVGHLTNDVLDRILDAVVELLRPGA